MEKNHHNALLIFARSPQIDRSNRDEPFTALPWEDLDALFTAILGDVVQIASQLPNVDVFLYQDQKQLSDDLRSPHRERIRSRQLSEGTLTEQIQTAVKDAFLEGYDNVVVLIENHPLVKLVPLERVFDQLTYEDDCIVIGPTVDGKAYLLGMKSNHAELFLQTDGDPLSKPALLMERLCATEVILFPTHVTYSLDSASNLARLKHDVEFLTLNKANPPQRTHDIFKVFDKKYKARKAAR